MDIPFAQLSVEPGQIQPHALQVALENAAVHNQFGKQQLLLRVETHVIGRGGALAAHRKNGKNSIVLKDSGLDVRQVKITLLPAHDHELAEIQLGLRQIFPIQLSMVHQDGRRSVEIFPHPRKLFRHRAHQYRDPAVEDHCNKRLPRLLQLGGHFGGDRADGDSGNIVEKIQLGDLLMPHELRHQEQHGNGTERRHAKNHKIDLRSPPLPLV